MGRDFHPESQYICMSKFHVQLATLVGKLNGRKTYVLKRIAVRILCQF